MHSKGLGEFEGVCYRVHNSTSCVCEGVRRMCVCVCVCGSLQRCLTACTCRCMCVCSYSLDSPKQFSMTALGNSNMRGSVPGWTPSIANEP